MLEGNVLITGGAGTLGTAIIRKATQEGWNAKFTVYSRDPLKHHRLKNKFPEVSCVVGDIGDMASLEKAMTGHDIVIHAAAQKHIPEGEAYPLSTYDTNVNGSIAVAMAAARTPGLKKVIGISTDKACHPVNAYGCSKMMMERLFQEFSKSYDSPEFILVRYGNVIGSNGSVVQVWGRMVEEGGKIYATSPDMTRYWLTAEQAVELITFALATSPNGTILVPQIPSLSMLKMKEYLFPDAEVEYMGLRPGEKLHETMLTQEEGHYVNEISYSSEKYEHQFPFRGLYLLWPVTGTPVANPRDEYTSQNEPTELTKDELREMVGA